MNQALNPSVDVLVFNSSTKPLQVKIKKVFEIHISTLCFIRILKFGLDLLVDESMKLLSQLAYWSENKPRETNSRKDDFLFKSLLNMTANFLLSNIHFGIGS